MCELGLREGGMMDSRCDSMLTFLLFLSWGLLVAVIRIRCGEKMIRLCSGMVINLFDFD